MPSEPHAIDGGPVSADVAARADAPAARAEPSPWPLNAKLARVGWWLVRATLFRCSFHNWYAWRNALLRACGARIGRGVRVRPTVSIEMPWNLDLADDVIVGDHAILYSLGRITIGPRTVVSQYAHLCAGTHDHAKRSFPLLTPPITLGADVWVAADAFVGPGVTVGDRSVVAARATVVADVPPDQIVGGNPAKYLKPRIFDESTGT